MSQYRKKPVVIEATQWRQHGDHPAVRPATLEQAAGITPGVPWQLCGWVKTLEGGHVVNPGDWIITGIKGEHYPCKPDIFAATYEPADGAQDVARSTDPQDCDAVCPRCEGSGEEITQSDSGPDSRDVTINCQHCDGSRSLTKGTLVWNLVPVFAPTHIRAIAKKEGSSS